MITSFVCRRAISASFQFSLAFTSGYEKKTRRDRPVGIQTLVFNHRAANYERYSHVYLRIVRLNRHVMPRPYTEAAHGSAEFRKENQKLEVRSVRMSPFVAGSPFYAMLPPTPRRQCEHRQAFWAGLVDSNQQELHKRHCHLILRVAIHIHGTPLPLAH